MATKKEAINMVMLAAYQGRSLLLCRRRSTYWPVRARSGPDTTASMTMFDRLFFVAIACCTGSASTADTRHPHQAWRDLATALWLIASELLSSISRALARSARPTVRWGRGSVMLWFYISAYAVLLGAELNAILEAPNPAMLPARKVLQ